MKLAQSAGNRYEKIHKNPLPGNYVFSLKVLAIKLCENNNFTLDFYTNTGVLFRLIFTLFLKWPQEHLNLSSSRQNNIFNSKLKKGPPPPPSQKKKKKSK